MNNDWLTALKNSPVAKLNKHLVETSESTDKSEAARKSAKGKSKYLGEMHMQIFAWCKEKGFKLITEHRFHGARKYRFDFAVFKGEYLTDQEINDLHYTVNNIVAAVEYEGGIFNDVSGHKNVRNFQKDVEKYNLAQSIGWPVLRFTALNYQTVIQELEKFI